MKHKIYYMLLFLMTCIVMHAQEDVYIYNGNDKEFFEVNNSVKYIKCYGKHDKHVKNLFDLFPTNEQVMPDMFKITLSDPNLDLFNRIIPEIDSVFVANELIYKGDGTKQCCFNHILLQTKGSVDLKGLLESHGIPYISFERFGLCENEYILELSVSEALFYANKLVETGYFVYAQPSFYRFDILQNPMYPDQWGLKNTGQHNGEPGMDINIEPAWDISSGNGITIAVVDNGVQLNHPDLQNNLISGYDATGNGSNGGCTGNDSHGTCCAGIIAACDNNIGIKGIAYNAKILPIRCGIGNTFYDNYTTQAFTFLETANVDIVSCSWGGGSPSYSMINSINYLVTNGRNGLGTMVFFSTGNANSSSINEQASLPTTIAVGAMNPCGERKSPYNCDDENWGSNYGSGLDVVAPGVFIPTTTINSDYTYYFNGTSAACPHAAGVMALMLSANPCLTYEEARTILLSSCDKIKKDIVYTYSTKKYGLWNNYVGYGKLNAHKAVLMSLTSGYDVPYSIINQTISKIADFELFQFIGDGVSGILTGLYYADLYEIALNISFPYTEIPVITGDANGYSYANPNYENYYMELSNLTNTSATLKTWCFDILYDVYEQTHYSGFTPTTPSNAQFNINVKGLPINNNVTISNNDIASGNWNYTAYDTLIINDLNATNTSILTMHAGACIRLQNGVIISPSTGYCRAFIEPFNPCPNNNDGDFINNYVSDDNLYDNNTSLVDYINNDNLTNKKISIHPNPNNGSFYVSLLNNEDEIIGIRVFDTMGKTIYSNDRFHGGEIVLPNAKQGLYYVVVTLKDKTITEKIIIK